MWGPTEFKATGSLKGFERVEQLHSIQKPVLFIGGQYDEVLPQTINHYQSLVKGAKSIITPSAGHSQLGDNPTFYTKAISEFMKGVEMEM